ncbi:MAG: YggT family protein [Euryhalocaulis sp.]|nr:YggT family protein [Euryhalocaulis sp.]
MAPHLWEARLYGGALAGVKRTAPQCLRHPHAAGYKTPQSSDFRRFRVAGILCWLISTIIFLVQLVIIIQAVLSWLIAFDVINRHNQLVQSFWHFSNSLTEPILRPIRNVIPPIGGVDITPIIALIGLELIKKLLCWAIFQIAF